ncbi:MAG: DUF1349 domain-containing protein [Alphaproteobacteria bacterium]|nr:DUF1349 domain-containing protein [Alphaproteobacteria bacterium]
MLLGDLQDFEWYNEPQNVRFQEQEMIVCAEKGTDFWQSRHHHYGVDNGHFFFTRRKGNFSFVLKWAFTACGAYNQCGLMLRVDENNWIKASMMYDNPDRPMLGTSVTQNGYSDWAAQDIPSDLTSIWFKAKRLNGDYQIYYSLDGQNFKQIRVAHLINDLEEIKIGAYICNPKSDSFQASLSVLEFENQTL